MCTHPESPDFMNAVIHAGTTPAPASTTGLRSSDTSKRRPAAARTRDVDADRSGLPSVPRIGCAAILAAYARSPPSFPASRSAIRRFVVVLTLCIATHLSVVGATASALQRIDDASLVPLGRPLARGARVIVPNIPLVDGEPKSLQLEEFDVWAPNAEIVLFDAQGKT